MDLEDVGRSFRFLILGSTDNGSPGGIGRVKMQVRESRPSENSEKP